MTFNKQKTIKFFQATSVALFACFCQATLQGVTIVQYDTAASTANATLTASTVDASVAADLMTAGSGLTANSGGTWNWRDWDTASASFANAVAANDFWTWGFDVTAAATDVNLTSMDIRLDRSGSGPDDFEIQASVNGGAAISLLTYDFMDSSSGVDFIGVDLSALGTLSTGDSVVFTLAAFNAESTSGTFDLETVDFGGSDPRAIRIEGTLSGGPDTTAPAISTLNPADDATGVVVSSNLIITFDEPVQAGTGNITIHLASDDSVVETIDVTNATRVSFNGAEVTIDPALDLGASAGYYVNIVSGAIEDTSGNDFVGITDMTTWSFTTAAIDNTAPSISSLSPADDATDIVVDANLIITFDESVQAGTGNVTIHLVSDNSVVETIDVTGGSVSFNGADVTINPASDLNALTAYYVNIASGAIEDLSGNVFTGIGDTTTWNFTTLSAPEATVAKDLFAQGAIHGSGDTGAFDYYGQGSGEGGFAEYGIASFRFSNVDFNLPGSELIDQVVTARFTLTHNDRTFTSNESGSVAFFLVTDSYNGAYTGLTFNSVETDGIDDTQFTTAPISLGTYAYTPQAGGVQDDFVLDLSLNGAAARTAILNAVQNCEEFSIIIAAVGPLDSITYSGLNNTFDPGNPQLELSVNSTTITDVTAPIVGTFTPADGSGNLPINADLEIEFKELIQKGLSGDITIHLASDDSVVETIAVTSPAVTVNAATVTIDRTVNLVQGQAYYVNIAAGAFEDLAGNDYAGIADTTTWNFTTTTPGIVNTGPFTISENALSGSIVGDLNSALVGTEGIEYAILSGTAAPAMMKPVDANYRITPLFTVGDTVSGTTGAFNSDSAGNYTPAGVFDGIGAYELDANTIRIFLNHELQPQQGYSYSLASGVTVTGARVSYFDIDKATRRVVDSGLAYDTVYDRAGALVTSSQQINELNTSTNGFSRMCSSALFEPNEFGAGNGIVDRIYFNGEEASKGFGHPHGGTVWALDVANGEMYAVPAMGRGSWENVVQLDTGTTTHVAFVLGDDFPDSSNPSGPPLYLYIGEKGKDASGAAATDFLSRNGLAFGKLYAWKADNNDTEPQQYFGTGATRTGTFVEIVVQVPANAGTTDHDALGYRDGNLLRSEADTLGAFSFSRPEDLSANPSDGSQFVFASTGRSARYPMDTLGTIYLVDVDFTNINAPTGDLEILYDGDDQGGGQFFSSNDGLRSPDNLDWADDGMIYVQEDRAGGANGFFTTEEASIWQLNPTTSAVTRITQMDRDVVLPLGSTDGDPNDVGDWESSGIVDVSNLFGEPGGTLFFFDVQAHSVTDGLISDNNLVEGSQLCLLEKTTNEGAFRINPNSGVITVNDGDALDQSTQSQYWLRIQSFDSIVSEITTVIINIDNALFFGPGSLRFASYNVALSETGGLIDALASPLSNTAAQEIAEVIQINNPDVILLNEFDYDEAGEAIRRFKENYLEVGQNGQSPVHYGYVYIAESNTGLHSGFDLDNNGSVVSTPGSQAYGDDAFGFGEYPGQFAMALLSKYPIDLPNVRTFQKFLWKDMPGNLLPPDPNDSDGDLDLTNYYNSAERDIFRLSSKTHWDIPVMIGSTTIHMLCAHPTPPTFDDGTETDLMNPTLVDENGRRNHDEIRFWADYIDPASSSYIYDDSEFEDAGDTTPLSPIGGLASGEKFVILGDYNADDNEGDSTNNPAGNFLTGNVLINNTVTPISTPFAGPEADDTAGFAGGVRVDYALPSANQTILDAQVYWPTNTAPVSASDHRMVWVDLERPLSDAELDDYYASANGLTGAALQNALHDIIDDHTQIDYGDIDEVMQVVDETSVGSGQMCLIYSLATLPTGNFEGVVGTSSTSWNREHTWPRSRGVGQDGIDFSDLHNLYPCQVNVNSLRSAFPFDVTTGSSTSDPFAPESTLDTTNDTWEPLDRDKGVVARALLYMALRYDGSDPLTTNLQLSDGNPFGSSEMGILTTLLDWHNTYPPTAKEIARNNAIFSGTTINGVTYAQGNRNPFVDRPEYADQVFGNQGPVIPTMSEWAAIILISMILLVAGRRIMQRQVASVR